MKGGLAGEGGELTVVLRGLGSGGFGWMGRGWRWGDIFWMLR